MPSAIVIKKAEGKPGKVYYPLEKITVPEPKPNDNEVLPLFHTHIQFSLTPPRPSSP
jgi:hypothetical protein